MSFATKIKALFDSATALNSAVAGIYYQIMPDNSALNEINIVYNYSVFDGIDTIDGNSVFDWIDLTIGIIVQNTIDSDNIVSLVRALLDNYTDNSFRDVNFDKSEEAFDGEREQFITQLTYRILFQNN